MKEKIKECGIIQKLCVTIIDYNLLFKDCLRTKIDEIWPKMWG